MSTWPRLFGTSILMITAVTLAGCRESRPPTSRELTTSLGTTVRVMSACDGDSLRPSTAAPAEGLWVSDATAPFSVAVMVSPASSVAGDARLVRRVETVEVLASTDTLRQVASSASVRLELLPLLPGEALGGDSATATGDIPAAAYVLDGAIVVAAYEPCATSVRGPRLRYLRRDARGRRVTDVMLQRASGG